LKLLRMLMENGWSWALASGVALASAGVSALAAGVNVAVAANPTGA
jgi:hypothetical protein